jgi:hypothetical protein
MRRKLVAILGVLIGVGILVAATLRGYASLARYVWNERAVGLYAV